MRLATEWQKSKMKELGIFFNETTSFEDAGDEIRAELEEVPRNDNVRTNKNIKDEHLLEHCNEV